MMGACALMLLAISFMWCVQAGCGLIAPLTRPPPHAVMRAVLGRAQRRSKPNLIDWRNRHQNWAFLRACKDLEELAKKRSSKLPQAFKHGIERIDQDQRGGERAQLGTFLGTVALLVLGTVCIRYGYVDATDLLVRYPEMLALTWALNVGFHVIAFVCLRASRRDTFNEADALAELYDCLLVETAKPLSSPEPESVTAAIVPVVSESA